MRMGGRKRKVEAVTWPVYSLFCYRPFKRRRSNAFKQTKLISVSGHRAGDSEREKMSERRRKHKREIEREVDSDI